MKKFIGSLLIVLVLSNSAFAICYNKYLSAANSSNLGCYDTPPVYTPPSGCSISSSQMVGCLAHYEICCTGDVTRYEDGAARIMTGSNVTVGQEDEVANQLYEEALAGVSGPFYAPPCAPGYRTTSEYKGFVVDVKPDPVNLTKSEVRVSMFDRVGCTSFSNNTAFILEPIGGTGGGSGGSTDMTATNTILNDIKTRLDQLPVTDNNPVLTEIKTILENGLAVTGGGSTDMTATNDLLTTIKDRLDESCTTTTVPGYWMDRDGDGTNETWVPESSATNCNGLEVKDPASLQALNDIKALIASGGGSGGTTDMTATNGILSAISGFVSDIKGVLTDIKDSVSGLVNGTMADTPAPQYTPNLAGAESKLGEIPQLFTSFINKAKGTQVVGLVSGSNSFFNSIPSGGSSVVSFNGGVYGSHSFDFASWGPILNTIKTLILLICSYVSLKIIFLKG